MRDGIPEWVTSGSFANSDHTECSVNSTHSVSHTCRTVFESFGCLGKASIALTSRKNSGARDSAANDVGDTQVRFRTIAKEQSAPNRRLGDRGEHWRSYPSSRRGSASESIIRGLDRRFSSSRVTCPRRYGALNTVKPGDPPVACVPGNVTGDITRSLCKPSFRE